MKYLVLLLFFVFGCSLQGHAQHDGKLTKDDWTFLNAALGSAEVVYRRALGPPDYVFLRSDDHPRLDKWKEFAPLSVTKMWIYQFGSCQPVKIDFNTDGRSLGADFSALKYCIDGGWELYKVPAFTSCSLEARKPHC